MRHAALLSLALALLTAGCSADSAYRDAFAFASGSTGSAAGAPRNAAGTILANDQNFDREFAGSTVPVIINFTAKWCGPCHAMAPNIDNLAAEYGGRVKVIRVDFDQSPIVARRYNVSALPAVLVVKHGVVVKRMVGYQSHDTLVTAMSVVGTY